MISFVLRIFPMQLDSGQVPGMWFSPWTPSETSRCGHWGRVSRLAATILSIETNDLMQAKLVAEISASKRAAVTLSQAACNLASTAPHYMICKLCNSSFCDSVKEAFEGASRTLRFWGLCFCVWSPLATRQHALEKTDKSVLLEEG